MDRDVLELLLGRGLSLESIARRFEIQPSTVGYWVRKHGLAAAHAERHSPRGGLPRARLVELIEAGGTHRSMAANLGVSVATVRHWLKRFGLQTRGAARRNKPLRSGATRPMSMQRRCKRHGDTEFVLRSDGAYRCLRCQAESVARRRRAVRTAVVSEAGGRCVACGYDAYVGALQFHHVDRSEKQFALSGRGLTRSLDRVREEAKKCVLLCANCHAEVEGGVRTLALELPLS